MDCLIVVERERVVERVVELERELLLERVVQLERSRIQRRTGVERVVVLERELVVDCLVELDDRSGVEREFVLDGGRRVAERYGRLEFGRYMGVTWMRL